VAKVTMPQLGESVAEGTIGKWLKQPGDHVDKYEPLLEVITDKVNAEVPSPFEGVLKEILAEEGATVPNNAEIAVIETADDGASNGSGPAEAAASGSTGSEPPSGSESHDHASEGHEHEALPTAADLIQRGKFVSFVETCCVIGRPPPQRSRRALTHRSSWSLP